MTTAPPGQPRPSTRAGRRARGRARRGIRCGLAAAGILAASPAAAAPVAARRADAFVESIGVNTHLWDRHQVYATRYALVRARLGELGVRYLRDAPCGNYPGYLDRVRDLRRLGMRFDFVIDPRPPSSGVGRAIAFVRASGAAASVEGPNEYDMSGDPAWRQTVVAFQRSLHAAARRSLGSDLPVLAPAFVRDAAYAELGDLSEIADRSNLHHYHGGLHPGTAGTGPDGYAGTAWALRKAALQVPGRPAVVTEAGYPNALGAKGGHRPTPTHVAGRYIPRMLLAYFDAGIERTYVYEFLSTAGNTETDLEASFGLLRNDPSMTPKPAYHALAHLIRLLSDPSGPFAPETLDYALDGDERGVQATLLQKRDGRFYLALRLEVPVWDPGTQRELETPPPRPLAVRVGGKRFRTALVHTLQEDGSMSFAPATPAGADAYRVSVPDRVTVLELVP